MTLTRCNECCPFTIQQTSAGVAEPGPVLCSLKKRHPWRRRGTPGRWRCPPMNHFPFPTEAPVCSRVLIPETTPQPPAERPRVRARGGGARYQALLRAVAGGPPSTGSLQPSICTRVFTAPFLKWFFPSLFSENLWGAGWWGTEVHLTSSALWGPGNHPTMRGPRRPAESCPSLLSLRAPWRTHWPPAARLRPNVSRRRRTYMFATEMLH